MAVGQYGQYESLVIGQYGQYGQYESLAIGQYGKYWSHTLGVRGAGGFGKTSRHCQNTHFGRGRTHIFLSSPPFPLL